jgi:hypothetical protein
MGTFTKDRNMPGHYFPDVLRNQQFPAGTNNLFKSENGWTYSFGETVPTGAGYAPGCIFIDTDAAADAQVYINEGSNTAASFVALGDSSLEAELASTAGAGKVGILDTAGYYTGTTVEAALAEVGKNRLDNAISDPGNAGAIPVTKGGNMELVTAGAETRTLADPTFQGQEIVIACKTYVGNGVVTAASPVNATGNNTITFSAAGQAVKLVGVDVGSELNWRVVVADGAGLSTV